MHKNQSRFDSATWKVEWKSLRRPLPRPIRRLDFFVVQKYPHETDEDVWQFEYRVVEMVSFCITVLKKCQRTSDGMIG